MAPPYGSTLPPLLGLNKSGAGLIVRVLVLKTKNQVGEGSARKSFSVYNGQDTVLYTVQGDLGNQACNVAPDTTELGRENTRTMLRTL